MSLYDTFRTDPELEQKGVVIDYGDFRVTVARAGGANRRYAKVLETMMKPYRRAMELGVMKEEKAREVLGEVYASAIVLNWETKRSGLWVQGIESKNGDEILPFTKENVAKVFQDLPDLFSDIRSQADKAQLFRQVALEQEAGNS